MTYNKLLILGNHVQALGLCRQAAKSNLQVILFNNNFASIARYSKYCAKFVLFKNLEDLLVKLHWQEFKNSLVIATNDNLVQFLVDNFEDLHQLLILPFSNPSIVDICLNKRKTYSFVQKLNVPIPESFFPNSFDELNSIKHRLTFPLILKPAIMHTFHSKTGKKAILCENFDDLSSSYEDLVKIIPKTEIIVQEFINSGAKDLYSVGAFCHEGRIISAFMANRQRQNPMTFGNSTCYAKSVNIPILIDYATLIINDLKYSGFCEVEFMLDHKINNFKFLEINARPWKWHSMSNKLEIDLIKDWLHVLNNNYSEPFISKREDVIWVENVTDIYISFKELLKGKLSLKSYLSSVMKYKKEFAIFSRRDLKPALMYLLLLPYLFIKR